GRLTTLRRLQAPGGPGHELGELLLAARDVRRPRVITEVAPQLALDGRDGERDERAAATGVEALKGEQQADGGDLAEIVHALAPAVEPVRDGVGDRHQLADDDVT